MISVQNLTKRFGGVKALDSLTFEVGKGEVVGFLGPNGAGKTTAMRILCGYLPAGGGTARVAGFDVFSESLAVRRRIGYMPEGVPLYGDMRVHEYLRYRARLKGLSGRRLGDRVDAVVESCGLGEVRRRTIGRLSKGFRQRVGLADALVHEPDVLILDEPTIGLDPNQIRHVRRLIRSLAPRHTVLLSSHILSEVESTCDYAVIINAGRNALADGERIQLAGDRPCVVVEVAAGAENVGPQLEAIPGILKVSGGSSDGWLTFRCECEAGADVRAAVFQLATRERWSLRELREERTRLEELFAAATAERDGGDS